MTRQVDNQDGDLRQHSIEPAIATVMCDVRFARFASGRHTGPEARSQRRSSRRTLRSLRSWSQGFLARLSDGWDHVKELSRPITYRGPTPTGERLPNLPGTGWDPIPRAGCPLGSASKGDSGSGRLKCHSVAGVRLSPNDGVSARGSNRGHERPRVPLLLRGQARSCPSSP